VTNSPTPIDVKLGFERKLIASLLESGDRLSLLPSALGADHFSGGSERRIFRALLAARDGGAPVSVEAVVEELHRTGELASVSFESHRGAPALTVWVAAAEAVKCGYQGRRIIELHAEEQAHMARLAASKRIEAGHDASEVARELDAKLASLDIADDADAGLDVVDSTEVFKPQPPVEFLVDRVIQRGSLVLLGSFGGSGKTWLALGLLVAIASGDRWLGRFEATKGRAILLDYESGKPEICRRSQKIARGMGITDPLTIEGFRLATMPRLYFSDPDFERRMTRLAKTHDLIVIDSLRAAARGADENDSRIRDGLDAIQRVAKATGCAFVVIVHAKKRGSDPSRVDERELFRGSSAIFDAADVAFCASYTKGQPIHFSQIKARLGTFLHDFDVQLRDTPDGTGTELRASDPVGGDSRPTADPLERVAMNTLEIIRKHPGLAADELRERVSCRNASLGEAVKLLLDRGKIEKLGDGTKASPFSFRPLHVPPLSHRERDRERNAIEFDSGNGGNSIESQKQGSATETPHYLNVVSGTESGNGREEHREEHFRGSRA
jgi:nucleotide-binding universal stress UspA family protein